MVARTRFDADPCPVARSVNAIGDWWSLLIVRDAFDGSRRFGEFHRSLGIAKNILVTRLRSLEDAGVLQSVPAPGRRLPPRVPPHGQGPRPVPGDRRAAPVGRGGSASPRRGALPPSSTSRTGRPLHRLEIRAADGRPVEPEDTVVEKV